MDRSYDIRDDKKERSAAERGKVLELERELTRRNCKIALLRRDRFGEEHDHRHADERCEHPEESIAHLEESKKNLE